MTQLISRLRADVEEAMQSTRRPIHILYLIDVLWGLGGAEGVLLRIPQLLPKDRYRCTIGTFRLRPESPIFDQLPCPVREFPVSRVFGMGALRTACELRRFIRTENVQIVHTFFESADLLGGLVARAERRSGGYVQPPRYGHSAFHPASHRVPSDEPALQPGASRFGRGAPANDPRGWNQSEESGHDSERHRNRKDGSR